MRGWLSCCAGLLLAGCAVTEPVQQFPGPDATSLERALSGEPLFGQSVALEELPEVDLFTLTPAMRNFAEENTQNIRNQYRRAQALHNALLKSSGLGIRYYPYHTFTPQETFSVRQANCVSHTLLYVTMARHLGLNAHFNEVDVPDAWDLQNQEGFILLRHVNTLIHLPDRSSVVVDLEMERYSTVYPQRTISDELMAAFYYNNRGMEWLAAGDMRQSFLHLRRALVSGADRAFIWSNLAVLYRRHQLYPEAEALYLKALQVTPDDLTTISNLAGLYQLMGRESEAELLMRRAQAYRNSNPYYIYTLAQRRVKAGEPEAALELVLRAIRMQEGEPRFYELAAQLYEQAGDERRAATMHQRALAAQPEQF